MNEPSKLGRGMVACIFRTILLLEVVFEWVRDIGYRIRGKKPPPSVWRTPIQHRKGW
jgi:hypothetical protein